MVDSFASQVSRGVMPRRGWSTMDVPTGWVQVLRGPRPPSQKWLSVPRPVPQRQNQVPRSGGHVQSNRVQPTRVNPDASRELARAKIAKLEKALEVMGECKGPAIEALKAELERTRDSAKRPPINVEVDECRKSIQRSEKRIRELDAERAAEAFALKEAKDRLQRLEVEQAQQPDPNAHPAPSVPRDWQAEMEALKAQLAHLEQERDEAVRVATRKRHASGPMPGLIPAELDDWMQDRQSDLQDAMIEGDGKRVLEITFKMAEGAELQIQWAGGMGP